MAIQDSFNLSQATISQAYAYKCWYNYNYGGNTMQISSNDMGKITQTWQGELSNWRAVASNDENAYEIEDDDFSSAKMDGRNNAEDKTGYDGKKSNAGAGVLMGSSMLSLGATGVATFASGNVATYSGIAGAAIVMANALGCMIAKPNEEAKKACDVLQDEMVNAQEALACSQEDMSAMDEELIALSDEAHTYNEDANEEIKENKTEFDLYKESYEALMAKIEAGEPLSDDEKELLKQLVPLMQELGVEIEKTSEDTTDAVSDIYDEMGTYQDGFDEAAATIGEVEGLTDFAEGFDEKTKKACKVTSASQYMNAAAGATLGARLIAKLNIASIIAGGVALAGAAMSTVNGAKQGKMAGEVGVEIDMRKATQDFNSTTTDIYSERIDDYEGYMDGINDLELEIPDEIDPPTENPDIPDEGGESTPNTTSSSGQTTEDKDKKDKE